MLTVPRNHGRSAPHPDSTAAEVDRVAIEVHLDSGIDRSRLAGSLGALAKVTTTPAPGPPHWLIAHEPEHLNNLRRAGLTHRELVLRTEPADVDCVLSGAG